MIGDNEVDVYVKGIITQPVVDRLEEEKNSKKPLLVKTNHHELKLFLHPTKNDMEKMDSLTDLSRISSWALCTIPNQTAQDGKTKGYTYLDMNHVQNNLEYINQSCKISNSLNIR